MDLSATLSLSSLVQQHTAGEISQAEFFDRLSGLTADSAGSEPQTFAHGRPGAGRPGAGPAAQPAFAARAAGDWGPGGRCLAPRPPREASGVSLPRGQESRVPERPGAWGSWSRGSSLNRSAEPSFVEPVAAETRRAWDAGIPAVLSASEAFALAWERASPGEDGPGRALWDGRRGVSLGRRHAALPEPSLAADVWEGEAGSDGELSEVQREPWEHQPPSPRGSVSSKSCCSSSYDFSRRSELWERQRARRLEHLRNSHEAQDMAECSFFPRTAPRQPAAAGCSQHEQSGRGFGDSIRQDQDTPKGQVGRCLGPSASAALAERLSRPLPSEPRRKLEAARLQRERETRELSECTFAPDLTQSRSSKQLRLLGFGLPDESFGDGNASLDRSLERSVTIRLLASPRKPPPQPPLPEARPKTNDVAPHMVSAQMYVRQDVFTRLQARQPVFGATAPPPDSSLGASCASADAEGSLASAPPGRPQRSLDVSSIGDAFSGNSLADSTLIRFLQRQNEREDERQRRLQEISTATAPSLRPSLSARSLRLVRRRRSQGRGSSLDASRGGAGRERRAARSSSPTSRDLSFRPDITRAAAQRPPRGFADMSAGDLQRREAGRISLRERLQEEAQKQAPFAPRLRPAPSRVEARVPTGRLRVLAEPDLYTARIAEARELARARQQQELQRRQELEVAECTFRPVVNKGAPGFVQRMAESRSAAKNQENCEPNGRAEPKPRPGWV